MESVSHWHCTTCRFNYAVIICGRLILDIAVRAWEGMTGLAGHERAGRAWQGWQGMTGLAGHDRVEWKY